MADTVKKAPVIKISKLSIHQCKYTVKIFPREQTGRGSWKQNPPPVSGICGHARLVSMAAGGEGREPGFAPTIFRKEEQDLGTYTWETQRVKLSMKVWVAKKISIRGKIPRFGCREKKSLPGEFIITCLSLTSHANSNYLHSMRWPWIRNRPRGIRLFLALTLYPQSLSCLFHRLNPPFDTQITPLQPHINKRSDHSRQVIPKGVSKPPII